MLVTQDWDAMNKMRFALQVNKQKSHRRPAPRAPEIHPFAWWHGLNNHPGPLSRWRGAGSQEPGGAGEHGLEGSWARLGKNGEVGRMNDCWLWRWGRRALLKSGFAS